MDKRERAVSEVIGTVLIIAIVVPTFSAIVAWYIPATETPNEASFQSASQSSYVNLISQLESPTLQQGQIISQNFQLGIAGNMITPSGQSTLTYNSGGIYINASYQLSFKYHFLKNTIPTAISNRVIGTNPTISGKEPTNVAMNTVNKSVAYVTDYASNSITEINVNTHSVIGNFYAGIHPVDLIFVKPNYLFISNYYETYSSVTNIGHSTITVFNTLNNTVVASINAGGDTQLLYPSGLLYVNGTATQNLLGNTYSSGSYVYVLNYSQSNSGLYWQGLTQINASSFSVERSFNLSLSTSTPHYNSLIATGDNLWMTNYANKELVYGNYTSTLLKPTPSFSEYQYALSGYPIALANGPTISNLLGLPVYHFFVSMFSSSASPSYANSMNPLLPSAGSIDNSTPGTVINVSYNSVAPTQVTVSSNITAPTDLFYQSGDLYVLNYTSTYNSSKMYYQSNIVAINMTTNLQRTLNIQSKGYLQQPVSVISALDSSGTLLIVNNNTDNTAFFDPSTGTVTNYVWNNYLNTPVSLTYIAPLNKLAVLNRLSNTVTLLYPLNGSLYKQFTVGISPTSIAFNSATDSIYVTNSGSNNVSVISFSIFSTGVTFTTKQIGGLIGPSFALYDPFSSSVVILSNTTGNIKIINSTGSIIPVAASILHPVAAAMDTGSNIVYVANYSSTGSGGGFYTLNLNVPSNPGSTFVAAGIGTDGIAYDPYNTVVYMSNKFSNTITGYNVSTNTSVTVPVGIHPSSVLFDSDNGYLYITNIGSNNLTLYNTFTKSIAYSIAGGHKPLASTFYSGSGIVYFANSGSNQITSVNGGTIYLSGSIASVGGFSTKQTYSASGSLTSYGYTSYIPPIGYSFMDNLLLTNVSNSQKITASPNAPIAVSGSNGLYNISSFTLNIGGSQNSVVNTGTTTIRMQLVNVSLNSFHQGQIISYTDLFGNSYPAVITGVTLLNMSYSISTPFASQINNLLYNRLSGSSGNAPLAWSFLQNQFSVTSSGKNVYLFLDGTLPVYSAQFEYVSAEVVDL